ncbi:Alpha/Beta hydrolase protein [Naviculisporaceae sp. PSN 640]
MHTIPHSKIGSAASLPLPDSKAQPILSISSIVIPIEGRPLPLEVRVTIPFDPSASASANTKDKTALPVLLLSHGHGKSNYLSSHSGYAPLAEFYASHGFAVLQPTHLSSAHYALPYEPGNELHYKSRPKDMSDLIDHLSLIESYLPSLHGTKLELDRSKIVLAGHSLGSFTSSLLLGASNTDPRENTNPSNETFTAYDPRIKAGVLLAGTGSAGPNNTRSYLSENGRERLVPFYDISFDKMITPALVVYGDQDVSPHLTTRGADWHGDAYSLSPAGEKKDDKALLVLKGAHHGLGGISGWDAGETLDESPERLEIVRRVTLAWLWSRLFEDGVWEDTKKALEGEELNALAGVETK